MQVYDCYVVRAYVCMYIYLYMYVCVGIYIKRRARHGN